MATHLSTRFQDFTVSHVTGDPHWFTIESDHDNITRYVSATQLEDMENRIHAIRMAARYVYAKGDPE